MELDELINGGWGRHETETEQLALFGSDVTVDNFEGIAVRAISETTDQIVIISDDNFSDRQRTLIGFLDYDHGS